MKTSKFQKTRSPDRTARLSASQRSVVRACGPELLRVATGAISLSVRFSKSLPAFSKELADAGDRILDLVIAATKK